MFDYRWRSCSYDCSHGTCDFSFGKSKVGDVLSLILNNAPPIAYVAALAPLKMMSTDCNVRSTTSLEPWQYLPFLAARLGR
jgi:hypothetical protein